MRYLFFALASMFTATMHAQVVRLPLAFYALHRSEEKALYLKKAIGDSVAKSAFTNVPAWSHYALALGRQMSGDTLSTYFYQFLGDAYDGKKPDSAARYYRLAFDTWRGMSLTKKIYLQQSLLYEYIALDNKDSVLTYIHALEQTIAPMPDTARKKLSAQNTIASSYSGINQLANALATFRAIIRSALVIRDTVILRNAFANIASAYDQTGNDSLALYYTLQAVPYIGSNINDAIIVYGNASGYFAGLHHLDSARIYMMKARALAKKTGDASAMAFVDEREASILYGEHQYAAAAKVLDGCLRYYRSQPPEADLVNTLLLQAALDTSLHDYSLAHAHLLELDSVTRLMNTKSYALQTLRMLAIVAEHTGNFRDAYYYQKEAIALNDAVNTQKAGEQFAELQAQYETYRREEQIALLQKAARINELEIRGTRRSLLFFIVAALALLVLAAGLLYVRTLRNKVKMRHLKAELEMKALRSQMNPHFIFNSLNSIQKYIWENKREDAAEYLTKFARLIRLVLENSQHTSIKLSDELAALKLYIEMEHRRANSGFDYQISLSKDVDAESIQLPPLILQPYVENAIWHGLSHKDEQGQLSIAISNSGDCLLCRIEDDGIGRTRALELKSTKVTSLGTNISSERIARLQDVAGKSATVSISDGQDTNGAAQGTIVLLTLPLIPRHD